MSRPRGVGSVVALLALALTGCTGSGDDAGPEEPASSSASSPTDDVEVRITRVPPRPQLAACYRMSLVQATLPHSRSREVSCREPHTAQTIHVGRLDLTPEGRRLPVDAPEVQRQPARVCPVQLQRYVGGTTDVRRRSRFEVVWFTPTPGQAERGARWFRCDAVAVADDDRLLRLSLGPRLRGVLDRPGAPAAYGLCGSARPGTDGFRRVACALPHTWEAVSTIDLAGGDRYPGTARVRAAGNETCADRVQESSGPVLKFSYGWEWPTGEQWAAGQHYGYCWAPSRAS